MAGGGNQPTDQLLRALGQAQRVVPRPEVEAMADRNRHLERRDPRRNRSSRALHHLSNPRGCRAPQLSNAGRPPSANREVWPCLGRRPACPGSDNISWASRGQSRRAMDQKLCDQSGVSRWSNRLDHIPTKRLGHLEKARFASPDFEANSTCPEKSPHFPDRCFGRLGGDFAHGKRA